MAYEGERKEEIGMIIQIVEDDRALSSGLALALKEQDVRFIQSFHIRQTDKLEFLIEALTKLSRLESNTMKVKPETQEIKSLLEDAARDAFIKAEKKNIRIQNIYTGEGIAYFDHKWTKEAVGNVLDNAVKYSPAGGRVVLSAVDYEMYAAVSVKDFGIGIREEESAKIFGRFYRSGDVQQEEGVGLGLYLAREILKKENGYMKVKSRYGEGAEFILYLPKNGL